MTIAPDKPAILLASSRPRGNTFTLARMALPEDTAPLFDLSERSVGYFSYENTNADDDFIPLVEQLLAGPLWVLATPLYWYTMSAQAKTFLDRLSDLLSFRKDLGRQLRGKSMAVICSGSGPTPPDAFDEPFRLTCEYLGIAFLGSLYGQFFGEVAASPELASSSAEFGAHLRRHAASLSFQTIRRL
jgi:putative NADPH-quinone reductase